MAEDTTRASFACRLKNYLQEADYRVALDRAERESILRLRFGAYLKEGAIDPNPTGMFGDAYDEFENCWIFGVYINERLVSSLRLHVISQACRKGPALDVFPDIVGPMIESGKVLIDPTRFVANPDATRLYPEIPYLMLRVACMASEFFHADYCLATVRKEHAAFYRRVFRARLLCDPRPYPSLKKPICLMKADVSEIRDTVMERYPVFQSSLTERRMLFEQNLDYDWDTNSGNAHTNQVEHYTGWPMMN